MQPAARWPSLKPAFWAQIEPSSARCPVGPCQPSLAEQAVPGLLPRHVGWPGSARYSIGGPLAARLPTRPPCPNRLTLEAFPWRHTRTRLSISPLASHYRRFHSSASAPHSAPPTGRGSSPVASSLPSSSTPQHRWPCSVPRAAALSSSLSDLAVALAN